MSKENLVEQLVNYGYDAVDLEGMTPDILKAMLEAEVAKDEVPVNSFDDAEEVEEEYETIKVEELEVPSYTDPGWNDYVLAQFTDEELYDGNPTVDGLRRVVELLIGPIIEMKTRIEQTPHVDNDNRATATVRITIIKRDDPSAPYYSYTGSADACGSNLQDTVKSYPVAMAETRAEGRALRRALRLRNVAAEELSNGGFSNKPAEQSLTKETIAEESAIKPNQVNMIKVLAKRLNINVEKLVEKLAKDGEMTYNKDSGLSEANGAKLNKTISAYQGAMEIPVEILGYDANWGN